MPSTRPARRLLFAGVVGVGKTTLAKSCSRLLQIDHLDLDLHRGRSTDPACGVGRLDLARCLADYLQSPPTGFVIDVGGDTVFRRPPCDNAARLEQIKTLKQTHHVAVVLLTADEHVIRKRYCSSKGRLAGEFDPAWNEWQEFGEPHWQGCASLIVDTSTLKLNSRADEQRIVREIIYGVPFQQSPA